MTFRTRTRAAMPYLIAAALGFVSSFLIVAFAVFPTGSAAGDVVVPSVTGLTFEEASSRLSRANLRAKEGATRPSGAAPKGSVVEQDPLAGTIESPGTVVTLSVSGGQRAAPVPEVAGMNRRDAERALEEAGFAAGTVTQRSSETPRGTVIETSPAGGASAIVPGPVALVLSSGPAAVSLPDVTGRSYGAARNVLEGLGFTVTGLGLDSASTAPAGTVISQNPAGGRTVPSGSTIGLKLSAGIGAVPAPQP
jgi:beta-lactam-binding protein with PASTA domain